MLVIVTQCIGVDSNARGESRALAPVHRLFYILVIVEQCIGADSSARGGGVLGLLLLNSRARVLEICVKRSFWVPFPMLQQVFFLRMIVFELFPKF